jgi:GNAT superfamily N-acetyltransferase
LCSTTARSSTTTTPASPLPGAVRYEWRAPFENIDLNALHAEGFHHPLLPVDWRRQLEQHSLGWVCAFQDDRLIGFVNVAWDGGVHAFVVDTLVAGDRRHSGIGRRLLDVAQQESRAAGCEWLHVDFEEERRAFYFDACGFTPTPAGLIALG